MHISPISTARRLLGFQPGVSKPTQARVGGNVTRDLMSRDHGGRSRQDSRRTRDRQPPLGRQRVALEVLLALARQEGLRPGVPLSDRGLARGVSRSRAANEAPRRTAGSVGLSRRTGGNSHCSPQPPAIPIAPLPPLQFPLHPYNFIGFSL